MPRYRLVIPGILSSATITSLAGLQATTADDQTVLMAWLETPAQLETLLGRLESLGLGLTSLDVVSGAPPHA